MGIFGPSKKEVELEKKLEEVTAEKDRVLKETEEWKTTVVAPQLESLKSTIKSQEQALDRLNALDHPARVALIEETKSKLIELEQDYNRRKLRIATQLDTDLHKADQERRAQSALIQSGLEKLKAEADKQYREYRQAYSDSYDKLIAEFEQKKAELEKVSSSVIELKGVSTLQDAGLFEYYNPAESSVQLASKLQTVRTRIKQMTKDGTAARVTENFAFDGSAAKGKKFANDMKKLMLRAYNAEAENAIKSIRAGNIQVAAKRLDKTREGAQKLGEFINLFIDTEFHHLRLQEIELAHKHLQVLKFENEAEKERRAQLREDARVEAEIKKARAVQEAELKRIQRELEAKKKAAEDRKRSLLEKERDHYENVSESPEVQADEEALALMQENKADVEKAIQDLNYREANVKAGYVYVLSNVGAFGEDVVKIGMTRRLEPKERVKELSGASVPFVFDTHLMVFSDNARGLEHELHKRFSDVRVNKVNPRKEYFYTTPETVLATLKAMNVTVVEFTKDAEASEYRSGLELAS